MKEKCWSALFESRLHFYFSACDKSIKMCRLCAGTKVSKEEKKKKNHQGMQKLELGDGMTEWRSIQSTGSLGRCKYSKLCLRRVNGHIPANWCIFFNQHRIKTKMCFHSSVRFLIRNLNWVIL